MIVDTSAILAILFDEPDREELLGKIRGADQVGVGAPTMAEAAVVLSGTRGEIGLNQLEGFAARTNAVVVSFEREHWRVAAEAWARFGKGRHSASLNYGDCLAYATARVAGRPLLCKGDAFSKTDLALA